MICIPFVLHHYLLDSIWKMSHLAPKNKGWAQSWKRKRKLNAASFKCQELIRPATEQRHCSKRFTAEVIWYPKAMPEQRPTRIPQHLTSMHLGSRKMAFLQMAFMQRTPKIFHLPLLTGVLKWFSGSHQLSTINLQQSKIHVLFLAQLHPYPALLQEGANGNRPPLSWLLPRERPIEQHGQDSQQRHHTSLLQDLESTD